MSQNVIPTDTLKVDVSIKAWDHKFWKFEEFVDDETCEEI